MHRCPAEGPAPRTLRSAIDDEEGLDREATVTIGTEPVCGQLGELRAEFGCRCAARRSGGPRPEW